MFKLQFEPVDYILSLHYVNFTFTYGKGVFEQHVHDHFMYGKCKNAVISNLISTYGENKMVEFLNECIHRKAG